MPAGIVPHGPAGSCGASCAEALEARKYPVTFSLFQDGQTDLRR